ncbi:MAG: tyrosine-protein phosphatase [Clostridium sp.]|nr:tyrosine-protein phosphatase [Clostridium sp.]
MSLFESTKNTRKIIKNSFRYIRSDVPIFLSDKERQWLIDNDVKTIIDLREEIERQQKPCILENDSDFIYISLPVKGGNAVPISTSKVAVSYINMVDDVMENIINTIMNANTNVLYFCNAGKDRTGVVSAIILSKLGYSKQYIIDDYLLSGVNLKDELQLFAKNNPDVDIDVITPKSEYMERFLEWYQSV